ncbi:MAG: response regulator [Gammaproteobacteria bacterium]|nr:response regulator [Gammaproteobacteria bacterium]MCD8542517.1 response regulator [Gammaproteobacteria bacterium]
MSIKPIRALLIEDTIVAQLTEASVLENLGCEVDVVGDGHSAIQKAEQDPLYDVIFLDLGLPDIDALTVTETILEYYEQQQISAPPIIAVTAHNYASIREACKKAGMSGFIAKPLTEQMARQALENLSESAMTK